jgi:hypothetical protein
MSPALVAVVIVVCAGAVVAVSTRDWGAASIGLAVALVASALLSDPLPSVAILGVRVVAGLLVAAILRAALQGGPRQPSPLGWPAEALLATAGAVAGLGLAVGLAALAAAAGGPIGGPIGAPNLPGPTNPGDVVVGGDVTVTAMALVVAAGTALLALGAAPLVHGEAGGRRAIGLVLVTQAVLLLRVGIGGPAVELEEIARAALLVVSGATGAVIARAAAVARAGEDAEVRASDGRPLRV